MQNTLDELNRILKDHADNLRKADATDIVQQAIDHVEQTLDEDAQDRVDQGLTQLPTPPYQTGRELGVTR